MKVLYKTTIRALDYRIIKQDGYFIIQYRRHDKPDSNWTRDKGRDTLQKAIDYINN
jgi:hypothetical protein